MISLLAGSSVRLIGILLVVLGLLGTGAYFEHKIDADKLDRFKAQVASEKAAAISAAMQLQRTYDNDAVAAAQAERDQQAKIASTAQQLQTEVVRYVPVIHACVPLGLVRVLHAAAIGVSAGNVSLPAGKPDDACAAVGWPDLARSVIADFGTARANAAQLDALIGFMRKASGDVK